MISNISQLSACIVFKLNDIDILSLIPGVFQITSSLTNLLSLCFPCNQFVFPFKFRIMLTPYSEPFSRERTRV